MASACRSRAMFLSSSSTSACMPSAIAAAFMPDTPAPMTTAFAAYTPETPPISTPRPPPCRMQVVRADLRGEPAGDLGHRGEQRQRPVGQLHGLVRDAGDLAVDQRVGALLGGGQVQVGEEHLPGAHPVVLLGDRLLDLEHQLGGVPHLVGGGEDRGPGGGELVVGDAGPDAGAGLDEDLVTVADELVDARRRDRHAVLVVLDLAWDSDLHDADTSSPGLPHPGLRGAPPAPLPTRSTGPAGGSLGGAVRAPTAGTVTTGARRA